MRPQLRPGLQVLRRDLHTVQLGLDWPGVAVLPDSPALQAVLDAVDGIRDVTAVVLTAAGRPEVTLAAAQAALDTLIDTGAVVDQAHHLRGSLSEPAWAATWLLVGPEGRAADVVAARTGRCVDVWGSGQVADHLRSLLPRVGLTHDPRTAELIVVAADQEPSRSLSDQVMADGRPHLWAVVRELVGVLGPFVAPGTTACLRCVDRARTHHDPAWPTLVESASLPRGQIHACDPLLATLVATWAALELSLWACDLQPQTWGRTIEIPFGVGHITLQRTEADPACGCGWPLWQDTMGA